MDDSILNSRIPSQTLNSDDYTFYRSYNKPDPIEKAVRGRGKVKNSYDTSAVLEGEAGTSIGNNRLLLCRCFRNRNWSITVRSKREDRLNSAGKSPPDEFQWHGPWPRSAYAASESYKYGIFSIFDIVSVLCPLVLGEAPKQPGGVVIVSGATAAAKSQIVMALIHEYLWHRGPWKRMRPHLLTIEDPIETPFWKGDFEKSVNHALIFPNERPIDYTPRQLGMDVSSVGDGLKDALRQTPSVVFVSEVREDKDWRDLLNFAGTGHLALTTAHAGSLTEAMNKILRAVNAKSSADRAGIAERILGLVHIRKETIETDKTALIPTLWRQKGPGVQSFISDGLSAILPGHPVDERDSATFGRLWFAKRLLKMSANPDLKSDSLKNKLTNRARQRDLAGE